MGGSSISEASFHGGWIMGVNPGDSKDPMFFLGESSGKTENFRGKYEWLVLWNHGILWLSIQLV